MHVAHVSFLLTRQLLFTYTQVPLLLRMHTIATQNGSSPALTKMLS